MIINGEGGRATPGCTVKVGTLVGDKQTDGSSLTDQRAQIPKPGVNRRHRHPASPLGSQRLTSQFDLESELRGRTRNHDGFGLRSLGEAVVLLLVLLVLFVFPLVNAVKSRTAFTCRRRRERTDGY